MTRRSFVACAGLIPLVLGCGHTLPTLPKVYPVRGKVLLASGSPVTGGRVHLHPKDNPLAAEAFGEIESDGSFVITTNQRNDGAVPGSYLVSIEPYSYKTGNLRVLKPYPVPPRFREAETSGLQIVVQAQENVLEPIRLR